MQTVKIALVLFCLGLALWVMDFWLWVLSDLEIGPLNLTATIMLLLASFILAFRNKKSSSGIMFLGALMWFTGNLAVYKGSEAGLLLSLPGEALFLLSLPIVMYTSTRQIRFISLMWQAIATVTAMGITLRLGAALMGENLTETQPLELVSSITIYAILFIALLWLTIKNLPKLIKKPPL